MADNPTPYELSVFVIGEHDHGQSLIASFLVSRLIMRGADVDWIDPNGKELTVSEDQLKRILDGRRIRVQVIDMDKSATTIIAG